MKNLKQLLLEQIVRSDGYEGYEIKMYNISADNWPQEDGEGIDLENWRVVEIDDTKMVLVAGGDWQEGCIMTIEAVDGELVVTDSEPYNEENPRNALDIPQETIIEFLMR